MSLFFALEQLAVVLSVTNGGWMDGCNQGRDKNGEGRRDIKT